MNVIYHQFGDGQLFLTDASLVRHDFVQLLVILAGVVQHDARFAMAAILGVVAAQTYVRLVAAAILYDFIVRPCAIVVAQLDVATECAPIFFTFLQKLVAVADLL